MKLMVVVVTALFVLVQAAEGAGRKRVAILDFRAEGEGKSYASAARNLFEVALHQENVVDILERNQMETILREQGLSLTGCTDASCAVQIGKLLSADMVASGSLDKLGNYIVSVKIVSVTSGSIEFIETAEAASDFEIKDEVYALARRVARKLKGDGTSAPMFDFSVDWSGIKGGMSVSGFYARPLGATGDFVDVSPGLSITGDVEAYGAGGFRLLGVFGGSYALLENGDAGTDVREIGIVVAWAGPAFRAAIPLRCAIQMNLLGGFARTSRESSKETVVSGDPAFLGELEFRYYALGPFFLSLRGSYLRIFYTGEDLTELLYGIGGGFSL